MMNAPLRHYCTHFDRNYLLKGLTLYRSLERHGGDFVLHVVCLDDLTYEMLGHMQLSRVRRVRHADFEDPELLAVKPTRTIAEYCWTCTPSVPLYVLDHNPEIDLVTYLDADLFFCSSPEPIFHEFGDKSTLIVEHRFSPRFIAYEVNGKYNVQWLTFRRDKDGLATLRWWREKCIEWCFYRLEGDRMGDQKYLDCWPTRFAGVHVLWHIGGGVAPWNFANYRIERVNDSLTVDGIPLIFFHFHAFRQLANGGCIPVAPMYLQDGPLPEVVYEPYHRALEQALREVRRFDRTFAFGLESVEGLPAPGDVATKAYWGAPESCRAVLRKLFPGSFRLRLLRRLGIADHRDSVP